VAGVLVPLLPPLLLPPLQAANAEPTITNVIRILADLRIGMDDSPFFLWPNADPVAL